MMFSFLIFEIEYSIADPTIRKIKTMTNSMLNQGRLESVFKGVVSGAVDTKHYKDANRQSIE